MDNKTINSELAIKKLTLEAWSKMLLNKGMIDERRYSRMLELIERLRA